MIQEILSQQNPNYKRWRQLLDSKGIKKFSQTLVSGRKIVPEILKQKPENISEILISSQSQLEEWMLPPEKKIYLVQKAYFKELDAIGTDAPILVYNVSELQEWNPQSEPQGLEIFTGMSDPNNLGALLRSAEAFGVRKVILSQEACHPFHPKVTKASSGSNLRLLIDEGPSIKEIPALHLKNLWALDKDGQNIQDLNFPQNMSLLIGEEGQGIPQGFKPDQLISIPIAPTVESLNAVMAATIAMYAYNCPL